MKFELDDILMENILFHMENKEGHYLIDTLERQIHDVDDYSLDIDFEDKNRFIDLPVWTSAEGFRLMEKYTASLNNPILRQELTDALNSKKGVFRAFKNRLEEHPQALKQWFAYKKQKLKQKVLLWYNSMREEWGLEPIGEEPEDTSLLVMEDFVFRQEPCTDCEICFTAESADGENAGCICAIKTETGLNINKLEVNKKYQGMGLGKTLLSKLLEKTEEKTITIEVPVESEFFARSLHLEGFKMVSYKFKRGHD